MEYKNSTVCYGKKHLLDILVGQKMSSRDFINSEKALLLLSETIDEISLYPASHALLELTRDKLTNIIVLIKNETHYTLMTWEKKNNIDLAYDVKVHEKDLNSSLLTFIGEMEEQYNDMHSILSCMVIETLKGFSISRSKMKEMYNFLKRDESETKIKLNSVKELKLPYNELYAYARQVNDLIISKQDEVDKQIDGFVSRLKCPELKLKYKQDGLAKDIVSIGVIQEVRTIGNTRFYEIDYLKFKGDKEDLVIGKSISKANPGVLSQKLKFNNLRTSLIAENRDYLNGSINPAVFKKIPYDQIDMGRYLVVLQRGDYYHWNIILGEDPKLNPGHYLELIGTIEKFMEFAIKKGLSFSETKIKVNETTTYNFDAFEELVSKEKNGEERQSIQTKLSVLKKMVDEYKYINKKLVIEHEDIKITDKVKFTTKTGEISYGNFMLSVDDDYLKSNLAEMCKSLTTEFYRGQVTEQNILDSIVNTVFKLLSQRLNTYSKDNVVIKMVINKTIPIEIAVNRSKSGARILYINQQRFNKNEVIVVLKELTCYQDPEIARVFIQNIGRLGLSVYIGVSTGYEIKIGEQTRLYKFRKDPGRSNYTLLLDEVELKLKGKALISLLYSNFLGEGSTEIKEKIDETIFKLTNNSLDYLKFKFLIDSTYESYQQRSKEFLTKKVEETESTFVRFYNIANRTEMEAILLKGQSGSEYLIAYDKRGSYVYLSPEKKDDHYEGGKYICMVDQSSIKSNIGYDTVIAKLLALKNDSVIASKIYNLNDELSTMEADDDSRDD